MSDAERPSGQLATRVVDQLIEVGLVRVERRDQMVGKVASGTIKGEDWRLEIDAASEKAETQ